MNKYIRVVKKIFTGKNPLEVRLPSERWDHQFKKGYWDFLLDAPPNVQAIAKLITEQTQETTLRVLDVGCGNGIIPSLLKKSGAAFSYVGTDISDIALQKAKELYPEGVYICADMENPRDIDGVFDIVVYSEMLLYGNSRKTIQAHEKYCTPDTKIIISMYYTWRTVMIWFLIRKYFKYNFITRVWDKKRNIAWDVKMGSLK